MSTNALLFILIFAVLFVVFFAYYYVHGRRVRDPDALKRWKEVAWRDRLRIARAVRRDERLDNPREAALAVYSAEQQERFVAGFQPSQLIYGGLGAYAVVGGVLASAIPAVLLGVFFIGLAGARSVYNRRLKERLQLAARLNREQAG